jgi:transcriptional regulator with XRE-family HTH domain
MNSTRAIAECLLAAQRAKSLGLTQEDIANALGASQSQVSRVLSGQAQKFSGLAERVCNYVNSHFHGISKEAIVNNNDLMDALACVWDGSSQQARLLANLIRSAGALMPANGQRCQNTQC